MIGWDFISISNSTLRLSPEMMRFQKLHKDNCYVEYFY